MINYIWIMLTNNNPRIEEPEVEEEKDEENK